jgi:ribosome maturation factor RimP
VGESVKITVKNEEKTTTIEGEILKVEENRLTLLTNDGEKSLPINQVVKGSIIF